MIYKIKQLCICLTNIHIFIEKMRFELIWKWKWSRSVVSDSATPWTVTYQAPQVTVHEVFQARVLEWVAISFSRGSSWPRDRTWVSCIAGRRFTIWATGKPERMSFINFFPLAAVSRVYCFLWCTGFSLWWLLLLPSTGSRHAGSVVVEHGLTCSEACGIFLDQGLSLCPCIGRRTLNHSATKKVPWVEFWLGTFRGFFSWDHLGKWFSVRGDICSTEEQKFGDVWRHFFGRKMEIVTETVLGLHNHCRWWGQSWN